MEIVLPKASFSPTSSFTMATTQGEQPWPPMSKGGWGKTVLTKLRGAAGGPKTLLGINNGIFSTS
jgi:hypothetical protein